MRGLEHPMRPVEVAASPLSGELCILVVEDHADTRRGLEMLLRALGHRVTSVVDMTGALRIVAGGQEFDLLLSDLGLPDGNGWELLGALEKHDLRPPYALAMSGLCSCADRERSRAAGFRAHLVKPFPARELEAELMTVALEKARGQYKARLE